MTHIHTITYDQAKRWYESVREGLRNEQGAVEYVLDRPEE